MLRPLLLSFVVMWSVSHLAAADDPTPRIGFYGTLKSGLDEARRSGRPILFLSAAPQCLGVSGIW